MSVKIRVHKRDKTGVPNATVRVSWSPSGQSTAKTDDNGVADLGCSGGLINRITVHDDVVINYEVRVDDDATFSVEYNK